jgi:hypothetical protein
MRFDKEILIDKGKSKEDLMLEVLLDIRKITAFYTTNYYPRPKLDVNSRKLWKEIQLLWKTWEQEKLEVKK